MDSYTFRAHLNAVIIGLRILGEAGQLPEPEPEPEQVHEVQVDEVIEYLAGVEMMSATRAVSVSKALLTMRQSASEKGGTAG